MSQVLYRKWRPVTFDEVVGQEHVTTTLRNMLSLGRVGHAYLFAGPRGTGKTTTARLLAKAVNCLADEQVDRPCNQCHICKAINDGRFLDLIEIDAASNTGVDDVRDLREKIGFSPNEGRFKVYIIDEVHMLSTAAFNALLKTLEEPPPHAIFVLATTEAHKIPATVLSRCQRFEFRRIPLPQIISRLESLLEHEGVTAEPAALDLIARQATGALRDAESLLDQLFSSQSGGITLEQAQAVLGTASNEAVGQLVDAWVGNETAAGLTVIQRAVEAGTDPQQFSRQLVDYLRGVLFLKIGGSVPSTIPESLHESMQAHSDGLEFGELVAGIRRFGAAVVEGKGGWQPQLPLELTFVESVEARRESYLPPSTVARPKSGHAKPAEKVPSQTVPDGSPDSSAEISLSTLLARRNELRNLLRRHKKYPVEALLNSGQILAVEGYTVILGFESDVLREKMRADNNRRAVEEALSELMGVAMSIRCVDPLGYQPDEAEDETAALAHEDIEELRRFGVEDLNSQIIETG